MVATAIYSVVERNHIYYYYYYQGVINWTVVNQLGWQYLRRSTAAVYHTDRQALSTARLRRMGQLATADTCFTKQQLTTSCWYVTHTTHRQNVKHKNIPPALVATNQCGSNRADLGTFLQLDTLTYQQQCSLPPLRSTSTFLYHCSLTDW